MRDKKLYPGAILLVIALMCMISIAAAADISFTEDRTTPGVIINGGTDERETGTVDWIVVDFRDGENLGTIGSSDLVNKTFQFNLINAQKEFLYAWDETEFEAQLSSLPAETTHIEIDSTMSGNNSVSFGNSLTPLWWTDKYIVGSIADTLSVTPYDPETINTKDEWKAEMPGLREYVKQNDLPFDRTDESAAEEGAFHEWAALELLDSSSPAYIYFYLGTKLNGGDSDLVLHAFYQAKESNLDFHEDYSGQSIGIGNYPEYGYAFSDSQKWLMDKIMSEKI